MKLFTLMPARTALVASATAALLGSMLVASPANAAEAAPTPEPAISEATVQSLFDATNQKTQQFDGALARQHGVDPALVDSYATGFAATGGTVENATIDSAQVAKLRSAAIGTGVHREEPLRLHRRAAQRVPQQLQRERDDLRHWRRCGSHRDHRRNPCGCRSIARRVRRQGSRYRHPQHPAVDDHLVQLAVAAHQRKGATNAIPHRRPAHVGRRHRRSSDHARNRQQRRTPAGQHHIDTAHDPHAAVGQHRDRLRSSSDRHSKPKADEPDTRLKLTTRCRSDATKDSRR
jgi:hypothetical protein